MNRHSNPYPLSALFAAVAVLAACGGGGGDSPAPAAPATVDVATSVIDGPIGNALVCLDKNDNGACDADEPSGRTAADGTVTLQVAPEDAGRHSLVAVVGTDAVDSLYGPVTQTYTLTTPADKPALLSPLTTLVKAQVDASSLTTAAAEKALQDQLGIDASLFADFTKANDTQSIMLGGLARVVALVKGKAYDTLKAAEGSKDSSGGTISRGDLERLVDQLIAANAQPLLAQALASDAVRDASTPAARDAALKAAADAYAAAANIDAAAAVGAMKQARGAGVADVATDVPKPGATLRWFTYAGPGSWYFRAFEATVEQQVPDASGMRHFTEKRKRAQNGTVAVWGEAADFGRNDLYWNGTDWFACPTDYVHPATPFDADGVSESHYCGAWHGRNRRVARDIAGAKLSDVVREIRAYPLKDTEGDFPAWGPNPDDPLLANLTFPAGSKLWYYNGTDISNPDAYRPTDGVVGFVADVANGVSSECSKVTGATAANFQMRPATLEALVAANPAKPCVYTPNANTGPRNEWWSNSTLSIGNVDSGPPPYPAYTATRSVRVGFGADRNVTYYGCNVLVSGGSSRNCVVLGTGTYSIETLGDARVMRFAGVPADAAPLTYSREFVERGGAVYYAYRTKLRQTYQVRPNLEATDALFAPLGITR